MELLVNLLLKIQLSFYTSYELPSYVPYFVPSFVRRYLRTYAHLARSCVKWCEHPVGCNTYWFHGKNLSSGKIQPIFFFSWTLSKKNNSVGLFSRSNHNYFIPRALPDQTPEESYRIFFLFERVHGKKTWLDFFLMKFPFPESQRARAYGVLIFREFSQNYSRRSW